MSALGDEIKAMIAQSGPITVERYMELALGHPEHGYYMSRDPFGAAGDFTTSPEISQMFGELIGLWAAEVWMAMERPNPVRLIELGPGRGSLMSDALRAARVIPEFRAALEVHLIETSPTLATIQHEALISGGVPIAWSLDFNEAPEGPAIILANEFLDALPVRQFVKASGNWRERTVRLNADGKLVFGLAESAEPYLNMHAREGDILEASPTGHKLMYSLGSRLARQGGAALFIDYGHTITGYGDTLQAVGRHQHVLPLTDPGECDLTAHVDFAAMARSARAAGAAVHGPIDQGDFLRALGIDQRAAALSARASAEMAAEIESARTRLVGKGKDEMGALFKAMVVANRALSRPPGFQPPGARPA
jgi:NADH dehydrogenase [ubiquinone] 1 alpha subcomplex assembly factor 7